MQDILIRIETDDFAAWEEQHYLHAGSRKRYGIQDGPAYRDLENPNAALFHIRVEDMDRAERSISASLTDRDVTALQRILAKLIRANEGSHSQR
jgi:hypothetical protein